MKPERIIAGAIVAGFVALAVVKYAHRPVQPVEPVEPYGPVELIDILSHMPSTVTEVHVTGHGQIVDIIVNAQQTTVTLEGE